MVCLAVRWQGAVFLLGSFGLFLIFSYTRVSLCSGKLTIQKVGRFLEVKVQEVENVQVRQHMLDRFFGTGELRIEVQGERDLLLRGLLGPYEGWKQIKIAKFSQAFGTRSRLQREKG